MSLQSLQKVLANYQDPWLKQDYLAARCAEIIPDDDGFTIIIRLPYPAKHYQTQLAQELEKACQMALPNAPITCKWETAIKPRATVGGTKPLKDIKNIILVASAKGGVGKSTVAVNYALALQREGARVGILDADIYGPSVPSMLQSEDRPTSVRERYLTPVIAHGLQVMSIGYLINPLTAMIWRGPMATRSLKQLLFDTLWQDLDYLIVDMPPGTGDIQLTLAQNFPTTAAIVVTTPQEIALADARRGIAMFQKVKIPVLGIVENMSQHTCSACGHVESIFGEAGGTTLAEEYQLALLAKLPLTQALRAAMDQGVPPVLHDATWQALYEPMVWQSTAALAQLSRNYQFPKIVIE